MARMSENLNAFFGHERGPCNNITMDRHYVTYFGGIAHGLGTEHNDLLLE